MALVDPPRKQKPIKSFVLNSPLGTYRLDAYLEPSVESYASKYRSHIFCDGKQIAFEHSDTLLFLRRTLRKVAEKHTRLKIKQMTDSAS